MGFYENRTAPDYHLVGRPTHRWKYLKKHFECTIEQHLYESEMKIFKMWCLTGNIRRCDVKLYLCTPWCCDTCKIYITNRTEYESQNDILCPSIPLSVANEAIQRSPQTADGNKMNCLVCKVVVKERGIGCDMLHLDLSIMLTQVRWRISLPHTERQ